MIVSGSPPRAATVLSIASPGATPESFPPASRGHVRILRYYPRAVVGDGGITSSVWHSSRALAAAGARVVVAFDEGDSPGSPEGVVFQRVEHRGRWRIPVGLGALLRDSDVVVLHSGWAYHNVRAGAAARALGVPYVLEPRGAYDPRIVHRRRVLKKAWWWLWERRLVQGALGVHLFFDSERHHLYALGYRGPVIVAPNGVEAPADAAWDGGSGGYVLWYGRFDPEHKGIDLLLRGLARIPEGERPRLLLHGPEARAHGKPAVRKLVRELALERWVTIGDPVHGEVKWELLARAAAFAYPSRWEAFGNAVAEAGAVGVPTLVTPYPLGRFLGERGAALVVEPTTEGMAEGLRRVIRPEAAELGRRAREVVREEFVWERVAQSWLAQLEALL
jgi:glycosyltransferase involved in cell wall biosynthesis